MKVCVVGAGSWGTALALLLARNGHSVDLVAHTDDHCDALRRDRENRQYLPGCPFSDGITVLPAPLNDDPDFTLIAVPSAFVGEALRTIEPGVICLASKGLDPETGVVLSDLAEAMHPTAEIVAISGPNLAVEVARGIPTAAVAASYTEDAALMIREALNGLSFRVYISDDLRGVELAGALKNVYAIGAGINDGLGFGDNTKGAFLSRGLAEMSRLGLALGARMETFLGLSGVGDLFATASSKLSRNYRVGFALGEGRSLEEAVNALGQVAEGVPTCEVALRLAHKHGVNVPLMQVLHEFMHGHCNRDEAIRRLMERQTLRES